MKLSPADIEKIRGFVERTATEAEAWLDDAMPPAGVSQKQRKQTIRDANEILWILKRGAR